MKCDNVQCKVHTKITNTQLLTCIWCKRKFHKQCLMYNTIVLFEKSNNIECSYCNPMYPIQIEEEGVLRNKNLQIIHLGDSIIPELEQSKYKIDMNYIYPIGYCSKRKFPSYKHKGVSTTIKCEILYVDENYFKPLCGCGDKDVYLFKITFEDDKYNPIEVLRSPKFIAGHIKKRYTSLNMSSSGKTLFGLNNLYIQYLILIHVQGTQDFHTKTPAQLFERLCDNNSVKYNCGAKHQSNSSNFLYSVNQDVWNVHDRTSMISEIGGELFDPQKELFNF